MDNNEPKKAEPVKLDDNRNVLAALSYIGILFLIPLLAGQKDEFTKFHVQQGIVLFIVDVIASFIVWVPLIGWAIGILMLVVSIYGFLQALAGKRWELPYLAQYAKKIKL